MILQSTKNRKNLSFFFADENKNDFCLEECCSTKVRKKYIVFLRHLEKANFAGGNVDDPGSTRVFSLFRAFLIF